MRHHRARQPSGDAPIVQAEILRAVERPAANASGDRPAFVDGVDARVGRRRAILGVRPERRNPAVGRIDDEPRPAAPRHLEHVAKRHERLGPVRPVDGLRLTLLDDFGQLRDRDILDAPAFELLRPLERRVQLVLVRVGALQIGIAPRRARRRVAGCGGRLVRLRVDDCCPGAQAKENDDEVTRHGSTSRRGWPFQEV